MDIAKFNEALGFYLSPPRKDTPSQPKVPDDDPDGDKKAAWGRYTRLHSAAATQIREVLAKKEGFDFAMVRQAATQGLTQFIDKFQEAITKFVDEKIKPVFESIGKIDILEKKKLDEDHPDNDRIVERIKSGNNKAIGEGLGVIFYLYKSIPDIFKKSMTKTINTQQYLDLCKNLDPVINSLKSLHQIAGLLMSKLEVDHPEVFKKIGSIFKLDHDSNSLTLNPENLAKLADAIKTHIDKAEVLKALTGHVKSPDDSLSHLKSPLVKQCPAGVERTGGSIIKNFTDWLNGMLSNELKDSLAIVLENSN